MRYIIPSTSARPRVSRNAFKRRHPGAKDPWITSTGSFKRRSSSSTQSSLHPLPCGGNSLWPLVSVISFFRPLPNGHRWGLEHRLTAKSKALPFSLTYSSLQLHCSRCCSNQPVHLTPHFPIFIDTIIDIYNWDPVNQNYEQEHWQRQQSLTPAENFSSTCAKNRINIWHWFGLDDLQTTFWYPMLMLPCGKKQVDFIFVKTNQLFLCWLLIFF